MIYCLDTDIIIEYFRGNESIKKKIEDLTENDSVGLSWLSFYPPTQKTAGFARG